MKQVLQSRDAAAVVRDVPAPPCEPGDVLVRNGFSVISSGTERTRVTLSQKSLIGKARERPDLVRQVIGRARRDGLAKTAGLVRRKLGEETPVGYSTAGTVLEVGEHVRGFSPGDRVACAGGGHANHAEIVAIPANLCVKVPDGVELSSAAFATIGAIAMHGIRLADVRLGERVGVIGCGLVGQLALRLLESAGATTVAVEPDPVNAERALTSGAARAVTPAQARYAVDELTGGVGLDSVIVTAASGDSSPLHLATELARDRGTVVLVGAVPIEFPRALLYEKELNFRVSRSYGPGRYDLEYEERGLDYPIGYVRWTEQRNLEAFIAGLAAQRLRVDDLIERVFTVDEAPAAYARLVDASDERPRGALLLAYSGPNGTPATRAPIRTATTSASSSKKVAIGSSKPVRVGLIGAGNFANSTIIPALQAAGASLHGVGGGAGPSSGAAQRAHGFTTIFEDPQQLIEAPTIDAVVICTRHGSHADLAARALRAGKHVFCEKPLALTSEELDAVLEAAGASDGILAVGFNRRFSPMLTTARRQVVIGGLPAMISYRVAAGQLPLEHWSHDLSQGGGRALGEGCHFVDSIAYLAGSQIASVSAVGYGEPGTPLQARDNLCVTLVMENGSVGSLVYSADGSSRLPKERIELFSGDQTAVIDDYLRLDIYGPGGVTSDKASVQDKGHRDEFRAFVEGIRTGMPPTPLEEIANVSLATLAIVEALRTGQTIELVTHNAVASDDTERTAAAVQS